MSNNLGNLGNLFGSNNSSSGSIGSNPVANGIKENINELKKVGNKLTPESKTGRIVLFTVLAVIFVVVLIIIIVLVVKSRQKRDRNEKLLIGAPVDAYSIKNNKFEVENSDLGLEFSMTMWIYISDWTQGWKNILIKGDKKTTPNNSSARAPGLWLYPNTNALHARINTFAAVNEGCDIKNIPLQKWVCIAYILNNRTVDIYINGKLERSCVLRGVPKLNNAPIYLCENGGFFGKISNVKYFRYALQPDKVHSIYSSGPY